MSQTNPAEGGTDTLVRPSDAEVLDPFAVPDDGDTGDHDRFAHYVRKEDIIAATMHGKTVLALCGKKWVARRSPEKYPVCPTCKEIYESMPEGPAQ